MCHIKFLLYSSNLFLERSASFRMMNLNFEWPVWFFFVLMQFFALAPCKDWGNIQIFNEQWLEFSMLSYSLLFEMHAWMAHMEICR